LRRKILLLVVCPYKEIQLKRPLGTGEERTGSNNKDVNISSTEELPVMNVATYTEMPVPPTEPNSRRNQSALGKKMKWLNLLCCRIFIFSIAYQPNADNEHSHEDELPNSRYQ